MLTKRVRIAAVLLIAGAAALLSQPETASATTSFACTENQKTEVRQAISRECAGGSGMAWVYCSWTGLWEMRALHCFVD